jgi:hypothetical protein
MIISLGTTPTLILDHYLEEAKLRAALIGQRPRVADEGLIETHDNKVIITLMIILMLIRLEKAAVLILDHYLEEAELRAALIGQRPRVADEGLIEGHDVVGQPAQPGREIQRHQWLRQCLPSSSSSSSS